MIITVAGIDNFVSTNSLGIQAISDGLLTLLKKIFPGAQFIKHLKDYKMSYEIWKKAFEVDGHPHLYKDYIDEFIENFMENHPQRVEDIQRSDRVIICGDGIISDIFPQWCLVLVAEAAIATANDIPFVTLDQSINTSNNRLTGYAVKKYFLKSPISVRELNSLKLLKDEFNVDNVNLSIDTAFLVDTLSEAEISLFDQYLEELKDRYEFDHYLVFSARGKRPDFQPIDPRAWGRVIEELSHTFNGSVLFASSCPAEDLPLAHDIQVYFRNFIIIDDLVDWGKYNYRFFLYMLEKAVMSISDRYHQNVFSLLSKTPFIPVEGNTSKSHGLIEMLKYPFSMLPILTDEHLPLYENKIAEFSLRYNDIKRFLEKNVNIDKFNNYEDFLT